MMKNDFIYSNLKYFLVLLFIMISVTVFSQKVSIGESHVGDSVYLEFDFPREMQIDIYKGNTKLSTIPAFKGVKWFHLERSTKYMKIIETDQRTLRLIFLTEDTVMPTQYAHVYIHNVTSLHYNQSI